jgi:chaperone required for assembly of F1-ATPase
MHLHRYIKASVAEVESIELILGQDYQDLKRPEKKPIQLDSRNADQDLCG